MTSLLNKIKSRVFVDNALVISDIHGDPCSILKVKEALTVAELLQIPDIIEFFWRCSDEEKEYLREVSTAKQFDELEQFWYGV